jgi:hypothetical protein
MARVTVSEVTTVLASLHFDRRRFNQEIAALREIDFQAIDNRFSMGLVNYRDLIETVLDSWVQKHGFQATISVLCGALECNEDRLASGKSTDSKIRFCTVFESCSMILMSFQI